MMRIPEDKVDLVYRSFSAMTCITIALLYRWAGFIALATYNQACNGDDRFVGRDYFVPDERTLIAAVLIVAVPMLLAHSAALVKANAAISLFFLLFAASLILTAGSLPEECVTMGGSYEDRASGLPEFGLSFLFWGLLSYVLLAIDWLCCVIGRLRQALGG